MFIIMMAYVYSFDKLILEVTNSKAADILVAAAQTGKVVNIKKGQFLSPESMEHVVDKITKSGNNKMLYTITLQAFPAVIE